MNHKGLTLDILICTIGDGLSRIPDMLLPERDGIRYVVSVQQAGDSIPAILTSRKDVTLGLVEGVGLSMNRNNAIMMSSADICLIADDDNRYIKKHIDNILQSWQDNPEADILTFQAETYDGCPLHPYPAPYVCSVEITFRRKSIINHGISFNTQFGLGSPLLCAGEEEVFIADARRAGLSIKFISKTIVQTNATTTSCRFIENRQLQITKGATFRYIYGTCNAVLCSFKEAGWYLFHKGANPFPILFNMIRGIWILR